MRASLCLAFAMQILLACGGKLATEENVGTIIPGADEEGTARIKVDAPYVAPQDIHEEPYVCCLGS